jgi:3-oxoadipate enol-lactonase
MVDGSAATGKVHWVAEGNGPGLLLIHGAGGNAAVWAHQIDAFAPTRRVVAYDLPGFGRSAPPADPDFVGGMAAVAASVLDAAGVTRAAVVAQSLGGWAGLRLALAHPERVERLVLCCTMAGIAHPPALAAFEASVARMDARGPASLAFAESFRERHPARAYLYDQVNAFNPAFQSDRLRLAFSPAALLPKERLGEVRCPVLIVAGEQDAIWPPASLDGLVSAFPDGRMVVLERCGHSTYFEAPDRFNAIVASFLDA